MRRRFLITYDISDDKRRNNVFKALRDCGDHVQYSVFICPTTALAAVPADFDPATSSLQINDVDVKSVLGWVMSYPFNMMGRCPVMSVPSGHVRTGVPSGIQIVGRTYDDVSVFRAAAAYEKARGWLDTPERRPAL